MLSATEWIVLGSISQESDSKEHSLSSARDESSLTELNESSFALQLLAISAMICLYIALARQRRLEAPLGEPQKGADALSTAYEMCCPMASGRDSKPVMSVFKFLSTVSAMLWSKGRQKTQQPTTYLHFGSKVLEILPAQGSNSELTIRSVDNNHSAARNNHTLHSHRSDANATHAQLSWGQNQAP